MDSHLIKFVDHTITTNYWHMNVRKVKKNERLVEMKKEGKGRCLTLGLKIARSQIWQHWNCANYFSISSPAHNPTSEHFTILHQFANDCQVINDSLYLSLGNLRKYLVSVHPVQLKQHASHTQVTA